jgi:subtilisin family serine protease
VPIRLIPDDGYVSVSDIIMAHRKAMELDVDIINNSWTSYDPSLPKGQQFELSDIEIELYRELYEEANEGKGILVIFASGNSGSSDFRNSPEARSPYTLAVGATDSSDKRSSFSTYGSELDLVAPGGGDNEGIYTTDRVDIQIRNGDIKKRVVLGYAKGNTNSDFKGTSAAAPVVAGAAALVWAVNPELTATEVRQILVRTAQRLPDYEFVYGKNAELGYGRVDARAAVSLAKQY